MPAARWQELDAIEAGFQEQLLRLTLRAFVIVLPLVTGHASSTPNEFFSCILVIQGFLTFFILFLFSSRQYRDGTQSWLCEALEQDAYMGHYIVSARDIYREGKPETAAYGYLARVDPAVKNMGTGKFLMTETIIQFGRTQSMYHGTVARTNLPQLKVTIVTRPQIGSEFQGEGCLYLVDCSKVPKVGVPAGARVARVD